TRESLKGTQLKYNLHVAEDGMEAMGFLRREGKHIGVPRPDVILLDLKLPRKDGHEVLREIKEDQILKRIPVVVYTTSQDERDILKAYNHYASCYVVKPMDLNQILEVAKWLENWLKVVKLPK
ncbi:MAG: response regulator, partial [Elusimicrobia bacterium RIFCSPLOWO2_01_FULL_60_11]